MSDQPDLEFKRKWGAALYAAARPAHEAAFPDDEPTEDGGDNPRAPEQPPS